MLGGGGLDAVYDQESIGKSQVRGLTKVLVATHVFGFNKIVYSKLQNILHLWK